MRDWNGRRSVGTLTTPTIAEGGQPRFEAERCGHGNETGLEAMRQKKRCRPPGERGRTGVPERDIPNTKRSIWTVDARGNTHIQELMQQLVALVDDNKASPRQHGARRVMLGDQVWQPPGGSTRTPAINWGTERPHAVQKMM
jgi:hypothetical protein